MNRFPVVFVLDDKFVDPACTTITSLLSNKKSDINYAIYICTPGLSSSNQSLLKSFESEHWKTKVEIIEVDLAKYNTIQIRTDGNIGAGSVAALLKFEIPELIEEDVVLYLDSDLIIQRDISELFDIDLSDVYAAVVPDSGVMYNKGGLRGKIKGYFNSGVMLFNCKKQLNDGVPQLLLNAKKELQNNGLVDQDAYNVVFEGKTLQLPIKYNCLLVNLYNSSSKYTMENLNKLYKSNYSCLNDLKDNVSIIHYASKIKPWLYDDSPYVKIWDRYHKLSPSYSNVVRKKLSQNETPETIPIVLATDKNYAAQTGITILSALENRVCNANYSFYILTSDDFSDDIISKLDAISEKYGNCSIKCIKMDKELFSDVKLNIPHITHPTFYRLITPSLFPEYSKMIYMDSDVTVEWDLKDYYSIDLKDNYIAGVKGASYHWPADGNKKYCLDNGLPSIDQYVNAGVLLINLALLREDKVEEQFIQLSKLGLRSQDQDVINRACYNHILHLDYKYNCMVAKYEKTPEQVLKVFTQKQINEAHNTPVIVHYAAEKKPWADLTCALADRWWYYAKLSPFYEEMLHRFHDSQVRSGKFIRIHGLNNNGKKVTNHYYVIKKEGIFDKIKRKVGRNKDKGDVVSNELLDKIDKLSKKGDNNSFAEMYAICMDHLNSNNPQLVGRLARMYRDGKGVKKDTNKAINLMRIAAYRHVKWAMVEYVDLLSKSTENIYNLEAYCFCQNEANDSLPALECRLARMYRDGIGVERNLNMAIQWMERANNVEPKWIGEYIDLLLQSRDKLLWVNAFELALDYSDDSQPAIQYRLSEMYRTGKGTNKDKVLAKKWKEKAIANGYTMK